MRDALLRAERDLREGTEAAIGHRLSTARIEQINTQMRLIARRAFGFTPPKP